MKLLTLTAKSGELIIIANHLEAILRDGKRLSFIISKEIFSTDYDTDLDAMNAYEDVKKKLENLKL